jgi:hypothetical protein
MEFTSSNARIGKQIAQGWLAKPLQIATLHILDLAWRHGMEIGNRNGQGAGTDKLHLTGSRGGAMEVARENLCSFLHIPTVY